MKPIFKQPTIKWATLIVLVMVVTFFACKRTAEVQANNETFNVAQAKEWYYGEFKKSDEFKNSLVKGKQLPNWEKGTYRKEGDLEIVDFPLLKNSTTIAVLKEKGVTSQGIHQIINASLKKIAFIKKPNNEIIVRELDYVPYWDYLETKGFDISNTDFGSKNNDFTGMVTVKKWGGNFILRHAAYKGKFYKKTVKTANTNTNSQQTNSAPCPQIENCTYTVTCEFELHGDVWVNTGICDDPVKGDCEPIDDPNCPPPNGGGGEEDPCEILGTCGGGGGGDVDECEQYQANAMSIMNEALASAQNPNALTIGESTYSTGYENGAHIQTKESPAEYEYLSINNPIIGTANYKAYFTTFLSRPNNNSVWLFSKPANLITYNMFSGNVRTCFALNHTLHEFAKNIREDKKLVTSDVTHTTTLSFTCAFTTIAASPKTETFQFRFYSIDHQN